MVLIAGLAGGCAAAAALCIAAGLYGAPPAGEVGRPPRNLALQMRGAAGLRVRRRRLGAALGSGLITLLVLGWPVAAVAAATGVYVLPGMVSGREPQRRIARLEALEQWARRLAEVMGASRGLEQALADSVRIAPQVIAGPVGVLAERLNNRASTEQALRAFAVDLDDPVGDLIATSLILASKRRGPGTRQALSTLADAVAQEVIVRREVEAERASLRTTLLVIVISVAALSVLFIASGTLAAPYGTPLGQGVLAVVTALYAAGLWWMRRLSIITTGTRFLHTSSAASTGTAEDRQGVGAS